MLHIDMDAFYASAEEARKPDIRGKPIIVCMLTRNEWSGAVASCSYSARALGIRSGMPVSAARKLCEGKDCIFLPVDKEYYAALSSQIMDFLSKYGEIEVASIDEAYLLVGGDEIEIAKEIKNEIKKKFGISVTIGIGKNKLLAKLASKTAKPDGLKIVHNLEEFYELGVESIPGVGKKTAEILRENGISTIGDLARTPPIKIKELFPNKAGNYLVRVSMGEGQENLEKRSRKQLGKLMTLKEDTIDKEKIGEGIRELCHIVAKRASEMGLSFSTITLMLIDVNRNSATKSKELKAPISGEGELLRICNDLLKEAKLESNIRRVGVFVGGLSHSRQRALGEWLS